MLFKSVQDFYFHDSAKMKPPKLPFCNPKLPDSAFSLITFKL